MAYNALLNVGGRPPLRHCACACAPMRSYSSYSDSRPRAPPLRYPIIPSVRRPRSLARLSKQALRLRRKVHSTWPAPL
eukprot:scaffold13291_cov159-Isochrysis_galbana.AAC.2